MLTFLGKYIILFAKPLQYEVTTDLKIYRYSHI